MNENIVWHQAAVKRKEREKAKGHKPCLLWYTGLSGSGKSTVANAVDRLLFKQGCHSYLLDGDNVRHGLSRDLGFDEQSRIENIRRIAEVGKLFVDAGLIIGTAFISPFIKDREQARQIIGEGFVEVFVDTPIAICEQRDPKGLYAKARRGEIKDFTGISSPYEAPEFPEVHIKNHDIEVEVAAQQVVDYLLEKQFI